MANVHCNHGLAMTFAPARRLMSQVSSIVITWAACFGGPFCCDGVCAKARESRCSASLVGRARFAVLLVWQTMVF